MIFFYYLDRISTYIFDVVIETERCKCVCILYSFNVLVVYGVSMIVNVNTLKYIFSVHVMYYIFWHMSVFLYKFACIHIYIYIIFK